MKTSVTMMYGLGESNADRIEHLLRVRELQARLRQTAWYFGNVTDDYGSSTTSAVKGFQEKRQIAVTGEVDRRTLNRLHGMTRMPTADELAAKNWIAYQGKSLRLNLDGSIPQDNPEIDGIKSHVFTYGHRNMQGIDFGPDGTLYASEQGPKTDDEVNVLVGGDNYGWPHVVGFQDDKAYQYARWADATTPCEQLTFSDITIDPSVPVEA